MRASLGFAALVAIALVGCGRDKAPPPTERGSAGSQAPAKALEIFVNDSSVATVTAEQLAGWPRLDTLVPAEVRKLGTWEAVTLDGARPKPTVVARPSGTYPDMVPAVFPGEGGAPAFGMFDAVELAKKGKPALREDHVQQIHIQLTQGGARGQNDDGGGAAGDPTKLTLTIKSPAGTTTLTGDKIILLPREGAPGNADQKGWRLQTLLEAAGVKAYERLVLADATGTTLVLENKDLGADTVPFIKLNKQGTLRFRVYKKAGEGWNTAGDLRGLATIDVK